MIQFQKKPLNRQTDERTDPISYNPFATAGGPISIYKKEQSLWLAIFSLTFLHEIVVYVQLIRVCIVDDVHGKVLISRWFSSKFILSTLRLCK